MTGLIFAVFAGICALRALLIRRIDRQERHIRAQNDELERSSTSDVFGRWGGKEFLVVAPHLAPADALALGEQLHQTIEREPFSEGIRLTVSIGIATYHAGESLAELTERADRALYRAKKAGRNRVVGES